MAVPKPVMKAVRAPLPKFNQVWNQAKASPVGRPWHRPAFEHFLKRFHLLFQEWTVRDDLALVGSPGPPIGFLKAGF